MSTRLIFESSSAQHDVKIERPDVYFTMIPHEEKGRKNGSKEKLLVQLKNSVLKQPIDGLSNLKYKIQIEEKKLYTHLRVKLDEIFTVSRDERKYEIKNNKISLI